MKKKKVTTAVVSTTSPWIQSRGLKVWSCTVESENFCQIAVGRNSVLFHGHGVPTGPSCRAQTADPLLRASHSAVVYTTVE